MSQFTFTPEEQVEKMVAMGVPRDAAERAVYGDTSIATVSPDARVSIGGMIIEPDLIYPIRFTLPWSALISENRRFCARGNRIFMTLDYKTARAKVKVAAREAMTVDGSLFPPLARPLALTARVWFPDKRIHDAPNFAGATHNALKGVVFVDDVWLHDARWIRAGVDVDSPRAELTIEPL